MNNLSKSHDGFTIIEILLFIFILAIIGVAGYFVAEHIHKKTPTHPKPTASYSNFKKSIQKTGVYSFAGYNFPYLPSDFVLVSKIPANNSDSGIPEVNYTGSNSLANMESEIITVCKNNDYSSDGGFSPTDEIPNGVTKSIGNGYSADCTNNKASNLVWGFDIVPGAKVKTFDITITSQQTLP